MKMTGTITSMLGALLLSAASSTAVAAGPAATIDQLAWMTGNYAAALGPNTLEENWIAPAGGSISAAVRMSSEDDTSMFEMITIEEADGSLMLHVQQFDPGFEPRSPAAQEMELASIGENEVHFRAVDGNGGFSMLGYSLVGDTFTIHIERPDGQQTNLELTRRSLW